MAAFLFLLSPKTLFLSFSSLSSLSVLPIHSCQQAQLTHLGAIISHDPNVGTWENALAKALARLKAWSKRNLSIHSLALILRTMILPIVDHVLSAPPAPTRALCLLEKNISQFLWDGPDGNRWHPMVDRATGTTTHPWWSQLPIGQGHC